MLETLIFFNLDTISRLTSLFISKRNATSKIIKLAPKLSVMLVKSSKVLSERFSFAKSKSNTNTSPRSGRNKFSEKYNPPT